MDGILGWIENVCDLVDPLSAGVYATVFALVVGAINVLFRRFLTAGQMGLLWGLVLLRLMLPVGPASSLSLEALVNATFDRLDSSAHHADSLPTPQAASPSRAQSASEWMSQDRLTAPSQSTAFNQDAVLEFSVAVLPGIWLVVGAGGLIFTFANYRQFSWRVASSPKCTDTRLFALWNECCRAASVRRRSEMVVFDGVEQPAIMGVFQPTLLLPLDADKFSDQQLRLIMLHELAHVRRWDVAANWLLVVIRAIHWWNPIYWLAAARFRSLQEQACDAFVIRRMAGEPVRDYRELLLTLAERQPSAVWRVLLPASILGFFPAWFRRRSLAVRLQALPSAAVRRGRWQGVAATGVVLLLASSGLTNATVDERPQDVASWMAQPVRAMNVPDSYRVRRQYDGPRVTRYYDIREVLNRMAEQEKISMAEAPDKVRLMLKSLLELMFPAASVSRQDVSVGDASEPKRVEASPLKFEIDGDQLMVHAPIEVQQCVERSLAIWAESGFGQISVASRIISADRDLTAELGITWEHIEAISSSPARPIAAVDDGDSSLVEVEHRVEDYLPIAVATLDEKQTMALVDVAQGNRRSNVLMTPKVTMFNGQEAMLADCIQRPFVVGVHPVVGELGTAMQPKIETILVGTKITVRAVHSRDRKTIRLKQCMDMSSVGQVETATASVQGQQVTIQIPQVQRHVLNVDTEIENGQTLLVGCLPTESKSEYQYFLLTVRNIKDVGE